MEDKSHDSFLRCGSYVTWNGETRRLINYNRKTDRAVLQKQVGNELVLEPVALSELERLNSGRGASESGWVRESV